MVQHVWPLLLSLHIQGQFLGHTVTCQGFAPSTDKVKAILEVERPVNKDALMRFLGMLNFYRRFIPRAAGTLSPLYHALKSKAKTIDWSDELVSAFESSKKALAEATMLVHPSNDKQLALVTDASDIAVGAVMQQWSPRDRLWEPLAFFSKHLTPTETRYSAYDKELLAIYLAIRHFRFCLEGRTFTIFTDHKPLTSAFHKVTEPWTPRQQRHLSFISEFSTDIRHVSGLDNVVADTLSRPDQPNINAVTESLPAVDLEQLSKDQTEDPEIWASRTAITGLKLTDVQLPGCRATTLCDISTGNPRPLVPKAWRKRLFDLIHGTSHPSGRATQALLKQDYVWHKMSKDIALWAKRCIPCQRNKISRHTVNPLQPFVIPKKRFTHVHCDIVGPLEVSKGMRYIFTMVDRTSRWPEAIPLPDTTAESCSTAFINGWIARFGVPLHVTTDRGVQFTSKLWQDLTQALGSNVHLTTAYHPQANGMVERLHRTLKAALKCRLSGPNWVTELPWVMLGLRSTPKDDIGASTAELVYGSPLIIPGSLWAGEEELSRPEVLKTVRKATDFLPKASRQRNTKRTSYIPNSLNSAEYVFVREDKVRAPLAAPYLGPFKVLEKNDSAFKIDTGGNFDWIARDRLKSAFVDEDFTSDAKLRPRGRPKKLMN